MSQVTYDFAGKVAIVTGAGGGIGRASALGFARAGRVGDGRRRERGRRRRDRRAHRGRGRHRARGAHRRRVERLRAGDGRAHDRGVRPPRLRAQQRRRRRRPARRGRHPGGGVGPRAGRDAARRLPVHEVRDPAPARRGWRDREHRVGCRARGVSGPGAVRVVEARRARTHEDGRARVRRPAASASTRCARAPCSRRWWRR